MKSEKAKEFIDGCINNLTAGLAVSVYDLLTNPYEA